MARIITYVDGPNGAVIEFAARALCVKNGGECTSECQNGKNCTGWTHNVDDVETVMNAVAAFAGKASGKTVYNSTVKSRRGAK
jgi:hypothetical protein